MLELEQPTLAPERLLAALAQHQAQGVGIDPPARRARLDQRAAHLLGPRAAGLQILDGLARQHRVLARRALAGRIREAVRLLDEQPLALRLLVGAVEGAARAAALRAHQGPAAAQLVTVQVEQQLAALEAGARLVHLLPRAAVPHDDRAGPVVALRDHSLEIGVLERMVLDHDRHALFLRIERGAARNRPGREHALHFEAEVVVQAAGSVLLDHEAGPSGGRRRSGPGRATAKRFRCPAGRAHGAIAAETVIRT